MSAGPNKTKANGYLIHRGSGIMCDCGVQVLGSPRCTWCGGAYPDMSRMDRRLRQMMRDRMAAVVRDF